MKIGQRLTELREKKGLTQDQIAEMLDIKRPRYNSWENNIAKPDIEFVNKLAELHHVSVDYLLGRDENNIPIWASSKDERDFKTMLEEDGPVMFDGVPISDDDKEKIKRVMEAMFWDAKKKNKDTYSRKKSED
ncbi:helix-turn-helix domain-containing protein [Paenibacillus sp. MABNS29]|uniref:helix-turn-helix domain-containing protein n=1 Tax=Paenibacillus sp. MABNS29 TaxID=3142627 RepID=UPI003D2B7CDF